MIIFPLAPDQICRTNIKQLLMPLTCNDFCYSHCFNIRLNFSFINIKRQHCKSTPIALQQPEPELSWHTCSTANGRSYTLSEEFS